MQKKSRLYIAFLAGFIILMSGLSSSYWWLKNIYLPEQRNTNEDVRLLFEWTEQDTFQPPDDGRVDPEQLNAFILANESLSAIIYKMRRQFEDNSWRFAFDIIKMQPEWAANKYQALKKFHLSPLEYDWIVDRVIDFWVYRWKLSSIHTLRDYGWEFGNLSEDTIEKPVNYDLFSDHEEELGRIIELLWPAAPSPKTLPADSTNITTELP